VDLYRTIVADPPWTPELGATWKTRFTDKSRPQKHYATLTVEEICSLSPPSAARSHLYLWVLNQHIDWGYRVARAWGFEVWNMLTWCKPGLGTGRFQCNTEHVLVCRKGSRHGNPFGPTGGTWFQWPRGRHSEKPQAFFHLVETVSPGPYLEMFARRHRDGWHVWGHEVRDAKADGTCEYYWHNPQDHDAGCPVSAALQPTSEQEQR
jgi:N6-adenosine-specific RNA methylase IME4